MFKVGSIRKIEVKNFVTYSYAELYPGPNLNMLIGPNGTGKSTIVAAIILGLGGNPKVVGRGHKVSEYVKHNCEEATISLYLQGDRENDFIKITRTFTIHDKSTWTLNNQRVPIKDVMDCIKQYRIQVDNLCQFLPQDRVQDFAKMNQQQLLKETQIALCKSELIEKHESLIECRENHKKLIQVIDKNSAKLQETQDANLRLEGKIENFSKKKKFLSKIKDIDRKVAWIQYEDLYDKMTEAKDDMNKANQIYEKHKSTAKPIEKEIQNARNLVSELQQTNAAVNRSIRECETSSRTYLDRIDQTKDTIRDINIDMESKLAEIDQKNQEIETTAIKIEEMKQAQGELLTKYGNDEEVKQKVGKITNEMQKFKRHVSELQNQKEEVVHGKQNKVAQLRAYENEINRVENVKQQRLNYLQRIDQHAYEAVLWLREHKDLFRGDVFEPIMLELNVLDSRNAVYVENVIPVRDRIAFTCTLKEDMNALIRYLRNEKKLTVNVLHSGDEGNTRYQPTIPIEQLKRFGLYTYLHSLFTAPEPIMRYLCKNYRVHEIPIGDNTTNRFYEEIPKQIRVFFSDNQKFSVSYSKYTGARITRQNEISSDGGLSVSVDLLHLERLQAQINEVKNSFVQCDHQIKEYDQQINLINEKISKMSEELRHIHSIKQQAQTIETRIVTMQRRIQEMRETFSNGNVIRNRAQDKIKKIVREMSKQATELKTSYKKLSSLMVKSSLISVKIEKARRDASYLENKGEETRRLMREAEITLNKVKEAHSAIRSQAKAALQKAKALSKNFTPEDEGFTEFREAHEKLSSDIRYLQQEKTELTTKIDCLNTADDDEMKEYEERVQIIKELQESIEKAHVDLGKVTAKMEQLQEEWLGPLRALVTEINNNFANAFERMGCAGEVSINPGDDEKEYSQYGLCIKVTYRNGEPLQELNNVVQSGGERAVATAIFIMALQELTPVPFRCVDEINQGMDANNERRIFDLLVETTSQPNTSQYFLITPKLVPNLQYSRPTMVHIVHNGPFVEADRKWSISKFCNPQRVQLH